MSEMSWAATKRFVYERAEYRCEYCQTSQRIIAQSMHVEHINPDGGDQPDNLCLSCSSCNLSKGSAITALDLQTNGQVPLFNPRTQIWAEHFVWSENGRRVVGLTATGRATIIRLKMNIKRVVDARAIWVNAGLHPP